MVLPGVRRPGHRHPRPMSCSAPSTTVWNWLRDDTFLVVGFTERTGLAAARAFESQGIRYRITDLRPLAELRPLLAGLTVAADHVYTGPQGSEQLAGISKVLLSPGVPRSIPLLVEADRRGIPVYCDVDLVYPMVRSKRIAAVTGTDGKTTTTSLVGAILAELGPTVVAGNIGVPVLAKVDEILASDWLVLELSSYMLERLYHLRADVSTVINVAEDHVDRYESFAHYARTKLRIVQHATADDLFVLNLDDPFLSAARPPHLRVRTVSRSRADADYRYEDGSFVFGSERLPYGECRLKGRHNVENILIAGAIGCEAGVAPARVCEAVRTFRPVAHRFELLGRPGGIEVYDDSKATTVHAVLAALRNFDRGVVLILGGRDKSLDFTPLRPELGRLAHLMCYGEAGPAIQQALACDRSSYVYSFEQAVEQAIGRCQPGQVLLLSPGCTSWDQHPNYEVRGEHFAAIVKRVLG